MSDKLDKDKQVISPEHDEFFKKIFPNLVATEEDIKNFIPSELASRIDVDSFKIEQESYIEEHLKQYFSDVVCSFKTKDNKDDVLLYLLCEHQSKPDYWIALRLLKYSVLLCEKHKSLAETTNKTKDKLPIIVPMVVYNGASKYTAPRNFWELFNEPELAKTIFCGDYKLLDLYATSDEEITNKFGKQLSTAGHLFLMKHIRDITTQIDSLLEQYFRFFDASKESDYIELNKGLWYIVSSVPKEALPKIKTKLVEYIPQGDEFMKSIAQVWKEEGIEKGRVEGVIQVAIKMLKQGVDVKTVATYTGLSVSELTVLKKSLKK